MARQRCDTHITEELFRQAVKDSLSIRHCLQKLGLKGEGGNYRIFRRRAAQWDVDHSHFTGCAWNKGNTYPPNKGNLEAVLVENYQGGCASHNIKLKLYKTGQLKEECEVCGITDWQDNKLSFHMDHINGINNDNRIENLRILCPNCHSQTKTYCGKNKKEITRL